MDENLKTVSEMILNKTKEANDKLSAAMEEKLTKVQNSLDAVETKLVKNAEDRKAPRNLAEMILNALNSDEYKTILGKSIGQKDVSFEMKYNAIQQPTNFIDGNAPVVLPFRELGVAKDAVRPLSVTEMIQWGTTASNMVDWIERTGKTDGSGMREEGGLMGEGDLEYTEKDTKVKIASEFMKVTQEALKDVDFLAGEINSELLSDLRILVDNQILNGDGTNNNLLGIIPQASAFVAGSFAGSIEKPNEADVLRVVINQIVVAGKGTWFPNYILMHPTDVAKLDLLKITDGRYVEVPFYDNKGNQSIVRVPIVQNVVVGEGNYLVGDFNRAKGFIRDALSIRIWDQNENDVLYNRATVTGNIRLAFRIKGPDTGAFVTGDFVTAKQALTT